MSTADQLYRLPVRMLGTVVRMHRKKSGSHYCSAVLLLRLLLQGRREQGEGAAKTAGRRTNDQAPRLSTKADGPGEPRGSAPGPPPSSFV